MVETTEFPTGSADGESTSSNPQGQADDYKARFQGMQREYNKLKSEHDAAMQKLAAKDSAIAEAIQAKRDAEARAVALASELETKYATVLAEKADIEKNFNLLSAEKQQLAAKMEAETKRNAVRKVVADKKPTLAAWFDDGTLKPIDDNGTYLEGDALDAYLNSFEEKIQALSTGAVAKKTQGAKPPAVGVGDLSNSPEAMSQDDLYAWLTKNPNHTDYEKYEKVYYKLVNAQLKK